MKFFGSDQPKGPVLSEYFFIPAGGIGIDIRTAGHSDHISHIQQVEMVFQVVGKDVDQEGLQAGLLCLLDASLTIID